MTPETDWMMIAGRYGHYFFGIVWMATGLVNLFVISQAMPRLEPAVRGKVMGELGPRMGALGGISALVTLLTGFYLFHAVQSSVGLDHDRGAWVVLSVILGVIVFFVAMGIGMPTSMKISRAMQSGDTAALPKLMARMKVVGISGGLLGIFAVISMMLASHPFLPYSAFNVLAAAALASAFFFLVFFIATRFNKKPAA